MKKRKKPIFLIAVFLLLAGAVTAMNSNLLSPSDPEAQFAQQQAQQASQAQQQMAQKNSATAPAASKSLVAPKQKNDDDPTNIKAIPAVPKDAPKIEAPLDLKKVNKTPDRASTAPNSGWYYPESGANGGK